MGQIETGNRENGFVRKDNSSLNKGIQIVSTFCANPFDICYTPEGVEVAYTGDYENFRTDFRLKGPPRIRKSNQSELSVAFLWSDIEAVRIEEREFFRGAIRPYVCRYNNGLEGNASSVQVTSQGIYYLSYPEYMDISGFKDELSIYYFLGH